MEEVKSTMYASPFKLVNNYTLKAYHIFINFLLLQY
jgi:hypothetical protein